MLNTSKLLHTQLPLAVNHLTRGWKEHSTMEILASSVALLVITLFTRAVYRIWFHPLAHIPGPFVARFTHMWQTVKSFQGTWYDDILSVHKKYGPVVRISPDEVSFVDGDALKRLYGHVKPCTKVFPSRKAVTNCRLNGTIRGGFHLQGMARFPSRTLIPTLKCDVLLRMLTRCPPF